MSCEYVYLKNQEDMDEFIPSYFPKSNKCPTKYPCILKFEDVSNPDNGYGCNLDFIYDMSNFLYSNGVLYKKESRKVVYFENEYYTEC